jgi:methionyl-tRNA formyltransferase
MPKLACTPLRVVFAGTPEFAVPCLQAVLDAGCAVQAVYSQPDRPTGRGQKTSATPVKQLALQAGLPVRTPLSLKTKELQDELAQFQPDLLIVVAYGMILPRKVLAIPRLGCWNVHASLLPRWRGAAPIQRAIEAGDSETGVCLMHMDVGLDTGPVYLTAKSPIAPHDTAQDVHDALALLGADLLRQGLTAVAAGTLPVPTAQSDSGVSYAHKLEKTHARLDFAHSAHTLANTVRAFVPVPIASAEIAGETLQIFAAHALGQPDLERDAPIGSIVAANKHGIDLQCASGVLRVTQLRRAGGKTIRALDYLNARPELKQ